ncbi:MAG: hypothetical protein IT168_33135 [Bryobacterales bacterium]|nr:hypothetical protein [Bryobacterales bacterium]
MKRCVRCGRTKDQHEPETLTCPGSVKTTFASMELPDGRCCNDCSHVVRCCGIFGAKPGNTECDWFPIRFQLHPRFAAEVKA